MKEIKTLIISEFSEMGGTRTFYNNLIKYFIERNKKQNIHILFVNNVLSESQIELLKSNNISYKVLKLSKKSLYNPKKRRNIYVVIYTIYYVFKYRISKIIFTQWGLNLNYLTLPILLFNKKVYLFVHSTPSAPKRFNFLWELIIKLFSKIFKHNNLITVSNFNKRMIKTEWHVKNKNIDVLTNFSNIRIEKKDNIRKQNKTLLTLGHVRSYKNPNLWLKIAREITGSNTNVEFVWAGEGERLEEFQEKTKNDKNINFIGYIKDVASLYSSTDIYLQVSKKETQGISVIDAMKYKIPCVVSNVGGLPESVINNHTGFVIDLESYDEYIEKINLLLHDENKRTIMGKNGFDYYNKKFNKEKWYNRLDELL